jgi:hypothetical protein
MAAQQVFNGKNPSLPHPRQLSFDELAALRASDEANAEAVMREVLGLRAPAA